MKKKKRREKGEKEINCEIAGMISVHEPPNVKPSPLALFSLDKSLFHSSQSWLAQDESAAA